MNSEKEREMSWLRKKEKNNKELKLGTFYRQSFPNIKYKTKIIAFHNAFKNLKQFSSLLLLLLHSQIRMLMKISRGSSSCSNNSKMGKIIIINQGCQSMDFSGGGGGASKQ